MKNLGKFKHFGDFLKAVRIDKEISLREFCKKAQSDPGNISKIERGIMSPPQDHSILERYAQALGIPEGGDDWILFFDLAAADCGIIPRDLMSDAEVVEKLPVFFRTLRGEKPTRSELEKIVEKIRRS